MVNNVRPTSTTANEVRCFSTLFAIAFVFFGFHLPHSACECVRVHCNGKRCLWDVCCLQTHVLVCSSQKWTNLDDGKQQVHLFGILAFVNVIESESIDKCAETAAKMMNQKQCFFFSLKRTAEWQTHIGHTKDCINRDRLLSHQIERANTEFSMSARAIVLHVPHTIM